jgi:hypothetical protein
MTSAHSRRTTRRLVTTMAACLALAGVAAAFACGCGGSKKAAATSNSRSVQVLATVRRGDLVDAVIGRLQLTSTKGNVTGVVQLFGANASQVAAGQPVTLAFVRLPAGAVQSQNGQGFAPSPGQTPQAGNGQGGQGFFGQGGQGFFGQGAQGPFRGKTAHGTVTAVKKGSNGSLTATIAIAKLPAGVTSKFTGIAQIQVKVLATNVLLIPRAAIKGAGGNATVQLLVAGKTTTRHVTVGQQNQTESEITAGLGVGDNIVYTRTFNGRFPGSRNGQSGGIFRQNGTAPSGAPGEGTVSVP